MALLLWHSPVGLCEMVCSISSLAVSGTYQKHIRKITYQVILASIAAGFVSGFLAHDTHELSLLKTGKYFSLTQIIEFQREEQSEEQVSGLPCVCSS